jgi:hypothetical protein
MTQIFYILSFYFYGTPCHSKFSSWWSSSTELPVCFHIFLSTLKIFQSLKFRFKVQSPSSSPSWVVQSWVVRMTQLRDDGRDWTSRKWEMTPQLRIRPPTWKIRQWCHNIWSSWIFWRSVFRRSNSVFGLSTFSPFRRLVIRRSVIRCWVPIRAWVQFCVRSFGVRSFGVPSFDVRSFGVRSFGVRSFSVPSFGVL